MENGRNGCGLAQSPLTYEKLLNKALGILMCAMILGGSLAYAKSCDVKVEDLEGMVDMTTEDCKIDYSAPTEYAVTFTMIGYVWWDDFGSFGVYSNSVID
jgi:hypothetical protein